MGFLLDLANAPEMVLRVAKAITPYWNTVSRNDKANALITARAAIEAMREPTSEMVMVFAGDCGATPECEMDDRLARIQISAMIDAALGRTA